MFGIENTFLKSIHVERNNMPFNSSRKFSGKTLDGCKVFNEITILGEGLYKEISLEVQSKFEIKAYLIILERITCN